MNGRPIEELNAGVSLLRDELAADPLAARRVQIGIITFGPVEAVSGFVDAGEWVPTQLVSKGDTPMGAAIERGLEMLEDQKAIYRNAGVPHYRPWVFLITDGGPTDSWHNAARLVREGEEARKFKFFAVGVEGANFDVLKQISVGEPIQLKGLRFRDLFAWLSNSLGSVAKSTPGDEVKLDDPTGPKGWGSIV
jgi:uncharacterized protein YegL